jgi:hypothetical protein
MKQLEKVAQLSVYGRHSNTSLMFVSQSYYYIPKLLRDQTNYIYIKKFNSIKKLKSVMSEYSGGTSYTEKELIGFYNEIIKNPLDFMLFDLQTTDDKYRVRRNWTPIEETDIPQKSMEAIMRKKEKYDKEKK